MSANAKATTPPDHACGSAFIGVHRGDLLYVLVEDRAVFDAIALPATDYAAGAGRKHCISKSPEQTVEGLTIIFQHWPHRVAGVPA